MCSSDLFAFTAFNPTVYVVPLVKFVVPSVLNFVIFIGDVVCVGLKAIQLVPPFVVYVKVFCLPDIALLFLLICVAAPP